MVWGSFLIAAAALKTPTRNGYNAQGVNLTLHIPPYRYQEFPPSICVSGSAPHTLILIRTHSCSRRREHLRAIAIQIAAVTAFSEA